jgi:Putative Ig domain
MERFGFSSVRHLIVGAAFAGAFVGCTTATFNVQPEQLPNAAVGQAYEVPISATYQEGGNVPTLTLSITTGSLPPGLSLRHTYQGPPAAIVGTPTTAGTYSFKLRAGGEGCAMSGCPFGERDYTLVVTL